MSTSAGASKMSCFGLQHLTTDYLPKHEAITCHWAQKHKMETFNDIEVSLQTYAQSLGLA